MVGNKLTMSVGDNQIVAEVYKVDADLPQELTVYLCDKDGIIIQDLCLVRAHYEYNGEKMEIDTSLFDCIVWADGHNEDYTNKFVVSKYEGGL